MPTNELAQLHEALRLEILRRIKSGKVSGKILAYQTRFKQSHISNFLNQRRLLSMDGLDRLLTAQKLSVTDLLPDGTAHPEAWPARLNADRVFETVPLVAQTTAIYNRDVAPRDILMEVPMLPGTLDHLPNRGANSRRDWQRFVAIRVTAAQAAEMKPLLRPHSILLIDRHCVSLSRAPTDPVLYAVNTGVGLAIRFVTRNANRLVLRCYSHTEPILVLEPPAGQPATTLVVGRVCQILSVI